MSPSLRQKLDRLRHTIESALRTAVPVDEPQSFYGPMRYALEGGGKRLRPALVLLTAEAVGGDAQRALPCAVAIELLHNFTLVHDDIMDRDELRRGRPTVHVKWDQDTAILAGDGLFALAYRQLFLSPPEALPAIGKLFSDAILEVCEGQALDKEFETRTNVALEEYLRMIRKKTARLFALSCQLGALCCSAPVVQVEALGEYGERLGLAFQIQDDLLDVLSSEEVSGKPQGSDIRRRKKTYLYVHALEHAEPGERNWLIDLFAGDRIPEEAVHRVVEIFHKSGAIDAAENLVAELLREARDALGLLPANKAVGYLRDLTEALVGRRA